MDRLPKFVGRSYTDGVIIHHLRYQPIVVFANLKEANRIRSMVRHFGVASTVTTHNEGTVVGRYYRKPVYTLDIVFALSGANFGYEQKVQAVVAFLEGMLGQDYEYGRNEQK